MAGPVWNDTTATPTDDAAIDPSLPRRYLTLIAEVTDRLMGADDPARMIDELFELIRTELRLDVFFSYRLEGDRLVLEAHGGLTAQEAEHGRELALGQAVCGCAASTRKAIHAVGVQRSSDSLYDFVRDLGLDAYACAPLIHGSDLLGTLGFGRRWADRFTEDELRFLHTICHYVALAKHRLRIEEALRAGIETQARLLEELNHRVRNALQVAIGLVAVDARAQADQPARAALDRATERLQVLASAHRPLYDTVGLGEVDLAALFTGVFQQVHGAGAGISVAGRFEAPVEQAAAAALLFHALLKRHGDKPRISVGPSGNEAMRLSFDGAMWGLDTLSGADARMFAGLRHQVRADVHAEGDDRLVVVMPYADRG